MNLVLVKMFATALALAQVTTRPNAIKTHFDPVYDQQAVVELLRDGCAHMRKAFDLEDINLDDLLDTALQDPAVISGQIKTFRGINFNDLQLAYREFCRGETADNSPFDMGEVIQFYNKTVTDLPDPTKLKGLKLPGTTEILDGKGNHFAELFESEHRRIWVSLNEIPDYVKKAFIAAEDKRFYQHHGIDERGLIRAFISNLADPGRPQGGSTITQQVAKNLLVGDEVSYERKIREMIVAVRLDRALSKNEILEIYINSIYLGRGAWGIDMAAQAYFNKPAAELSVAEGAFLAGLAKGPASFNPDRFPARSRARLAYVLKRMKEDNLISDAQFTKAMSSPPRVVLYEKPSRHSGFYFVDDLVHEAKTLLGMQSLTVNSYTVHSTINQKLQWAVEAALQEGLARYEIAAGRTHFEGPETNLTQAILRIDAEQKTRALRRDRIIQPLWQIALQNAKLPLYDVHWTPAIVLDKRNGDRRLHVGLPDGHILPLVSPKGSDRSKLDQYDVVYTKTIEGKGGEDSYAELRVRPTVQGGAIVLENKSGRILAMTGGFSYPLSQLNRTTQTERQPGSSIKPITYVTALHKGLQPNTLVLDAPITLPPIGDTGSAVSHKYWSPHNYGGGYQGVMTLRHALEQSRNLVTARLLKGGIDQDPKESLFDVCDMAEAAHLYPECLRLYPFVLGAQPIHMINLAAFYAAIANEGAWHEPYAIDSIEQKDRVIYRHPAPYPTWLADGDRVAFFQLRTMLEGVVARGTASSLSRYTGYVGGKTGTSEEENDAWFATFTSDVTIVVWVGYDNLNGRRTLGGGSTGGHVAAPIAGDIIEASWLYQAPKEPLPPPSPEAERNLKELQADGYTEYLRTDDMGQVADARYAVIGRNRAADYESQATPQSARAAPPTEYRRPQPAASGFFFFLQPQGASRGYNSGNGNRYGYGGYYNPNSVLHKND